MKSINRREFISLGTAGIGAALALPHLVRGEQPANMKGPIGIQTWIVRESIGKDLPGTLKMLSGLGYNSIELCSPPGYAKMGFGPLADLKASDLKKRIKDAGFTCISCHYGFNELKEHGQERIDYAKELGLEQMICSSFGLPKDATLSDWKKAADDLNRFGELSKKAGLQAGFHNHNGEFSNLEGELIYDALLNQFDANLVKMQFQVIVISIGYKAADYFKKYPGRFISAHLYDWPGTPDEVVALGKGKVDWIEFFAAAKIGGVKNYFVEMGEPYLKESAAFLRSF